MPFKKGKSGNAKGRAVVTEQQKRLAADLLSPYADRAARAIANALEGDDPAWACKMVMEYVFGKPGQVVELQGKGNTPLTAVLLIGKSESE